MARITTQNIYSYIFFQTAKQRDDYAKKMRNVKRDVGSFAFHYHVGIALGFPKKSVMEYAKWRVVERKVGKYPEEERKRSIGVIWAGFFFISYLDICVDEVRWMWETYHHPKAIENPLYLHSEHERFEIQYGDVKRLREVREYIMKERGLIPIHTKRLY